MKRDIRFLKYQGCGNDFIIVDEMHGRKTPDAKRSRMAMILTDRRFKIGADGLIFVESAPGTDGSMRLFEPAGNEADMCGNGIRCVADYLFRKLNKTELNIMTRDGPKRIKRVGREYRVDMGPVRTALKDLRQYIRQKGSPSDSMMDVEVRAGKRALKGSLVNSGEPHLVFRSRRLEKEEVEELGASVNSDRKRFPKGVNLNFVQVEGPHTISIRTYERGVYAETLACGTGATASAAVSLLRKWVKPGPVEVLPPGGRLVIEVGRDGSAFMTGPAECEFEGRLMFEC
jgi:diaminopimelate epimerase